MLLFFLLIILCIVDISVFAFDEYIWSALLAIVGITLMYFFTPIISHIGWKVIALKYIPLYIGLGVITAIVKWVAAGIGWGNKVAEIRKEYDATYGGTRDFTNRDSRFRDRYVSDFVDRCRHALPHIFKLRSHISSVNPDYIVESLTLRAKHNVAIISVWITQWPLVILSTLFKNIFVDLARHVATFLDFSLSYVNRKLISKATKGM